ncbi:amino acid transporter AVT3B isoform X2 [Nematostella vectensis]|nr:amino acid transporter AVT3B isoform X2 [Nematostella vectensis]
MIIKCKKVAVTMILDSSHQYRQLKADHCHEEMQKIRMAVEMEMTLGDIGKITIGDWGLRIVNVALVLTQTGFCVAYFIFMGNTIKSMFPYEFPSQNITKNASVQHLPKLSNFPVPISDESVKTITLNGTLLMDATHGQRSAPMFPLLLLIPLPFVVAMAFIRKIRKLGPISGLANIALLAGFFGLLVQILDGLHFKLNDVTLANWITFPIFFGQLTCAYEGIGCIIPIESGMGSNRPRFPLYLHLTLAQLSVLLGSFGVLGFLIYGNDVPQIVTDKLTTGLFAQLVRVTLIIAVLFTYPLQLFPVIQIAESLVFEKIRRKHKSHLSDIVSCPADAIGRQEVTNYQTIDSTTSHGESGVSVHARSKEANEHELQFKTAAWKRNFLRFFLVLITAGMAVLLKDDFAYVNALIGSLGSSVLAYILPCVFHLVLFKDSNSGPIVIKDIALIIFGVVGGIMGVVITVQSIIKDFSQRL